MEFLVRLPIHLGVMFYYQSFRKKHCYNIELVKSVVEPICDVITPSDYDSKYVVDHNSGGSCYFVDCVGRFGIMGEISHNRVTRFLNVEQEILHGKFLIKDLEIYEKGRVGLYHSSLEVRWPITFDSNLGDSIKSMHCPKRLFSLFIKYLKLFAEKESFPVRGYYEGKQYPNLIVI